jgi:hypothetical protein
MLVPAAPALATWFTIAGDTERDYPVNGTEQFTVKVAVPQDVATGQYSFRLDAINVANPDEDSVHGPAVAFEVTNKPIPIPTVRKGYLATLIGGAVGALAGLAIGYLIGSIAGSLLEGVSHDAASIVSAALTWLVALMGAVFGAGLALRSGGYSYFAETALILAGVAVVWVGIILGILLLIGISNILTQGGTPAIAMLCISGILVLAVPPLAARAITLLWKTGHL